MQRVVRTAGQHAVNRDEILHGRHLGREDDPVPGQADLLRALGGEQRGLDHRFPRDGACVERRGAPGIHVHEMRE